MTLVSPASLGPHLARAASFVVNHNRASLMGQDFSAIVFKAWNCPRWSFGMSQEITVGGQTFTRHTKIDIPVVAKLAASPAEQATIDQINAADSPDQ